MKDWLIRLLAILQRIREYNCINETLVISKLVNKDGIKFLVLKCISFVKDGNK